MPTLNESDGAQGQKTDKKLNFPLQNMSFGDYLKNKHLRKSCTYLLDSSLVTAEEKIKENHRTMEW